MFKCIRHAHSYRRITTSQPNNKSSDLLERLQSLNDSKSEQSFRAVNEWTSHPSTNREQSQPDGRARLSRLWLPTGAASRGLLDRAGFVKQAYSGVFHLLPLGLRVQRKIEYLIDKHMSRLGASKVLLSSISSVNLWQKSGRYDQSQSELFGLKDRRDTGLILSPTHEEEITNLVAQTVNSYKNLPLRLYQISRKYRDELRPRFGLLRTREFSMKDLYTFDQSSDSALESYKEAYHAYVNFFRELGVPFTVAQASSGSIGGSTSHEFHFPSASGEDSLCRCDTCSYCVNEEIAVKRAGNPPLPIEEKLPKFVTFIGVSYDRSSLFVAFCPKPKASSSTTNRQMFNLKALQKLLPTLDLSIENPIALWKQKRDQVIESGSQSSGESFSRIINVYDGQLSGQLPSLVKEASEKLLPTDLQPLYQFDIAIKDVTRDSSREPLDIMRIKDGDPCPRCDEGKLHIQNAIEIGHTFLLGSRYSEPLGANITLPETSVNGPAVQKSTPIHMGCHGIGISRLIGTIAEITSDKFGLVWPRRIAPFEVVILPSEGFEVDAVRLYDEIKKARVSSGVGDGDDKVGNKAIDIEEQPIDVAIDDRDKSLIKRLVDAELSGYPVVLVLGKEWKASKRVEVQCRKLGQVREYVKLDRLPGYLVQLLAQL